MIPWIYLFVHCGMRPMLLWLMLVSAGRGLIVVEDEHVKIRHIITNEDGSMATVVEAYRPRIDSVAEWHRKVCYTIDDNYVEGLWTSFDWSNSYSWSSVSSSNATQFYRGSNETYQSNENVYNKPASIAMHNELLHEPHNTKVLSAPTMRVATFEGVVLTGRGYIVHVGICVAIANGGCKMGNGFFNRNHLGAGARLRDYIEPNNLTSTLEKFYRSFDEVITIAQSSKTWHFPMENLPALMLIPLDDLASPKTVLHVSRLSPLTLEWLGIVMGPNSTLCLEDVSRENCTREARAFGEGKPLVSVISGDVYARKAIVPEMARCGHPTREQFLFLQGCVDRYLQHFLHTQDGWNASTSMNIIGAPLSALSKPSSSEDLQRLLMDISHHHVEHGSLDAFKLVVLTDRCRSRVLTRRDEVNRAVLGWAQQHGFRSFVLSDTDATPPLLQQLLLFRAATIVIGPHGGAEVNAISMLPRKSCLIEFYPYQMFGHRREGCYMPMARALDIFSVQLLYQELRSSSNLSALTNNLDTCRTQLGA